MIKVLPPNRLKSGLTYQRIAHNVSLSGLFVQPTWVGLLTDHQKTACISLPGLVFRSDRPSEDCLYYKPTWVGLLRNLLHQLHLFISVKVVQGLTDNEKVGMRQLHLQKTPCIRRDQTADDCGFANIPYRSSFQYVKTAHFSSCKWTLYGVGLFFLVSRSA